MSTIKELKDEVNKIRNMKQIEYSRLNRELEELESETIQMMVERDVLNEKIHENNEQIEIKNIEYENKKKRTMSMWKW